MTDYIGQVKRALTGSPDTPFVWLCNFEVENQWARGYRGLPAPNLSVTTETVRRMEELGALLAGPDDHLLLGRPLDPAFRAHLDRYGLGLPTELVARSTEPGTSAAVLSDPELLRTLSDLGARGARLMPMGMSADEQKIADATGLRPAVSDATVFERVNSKIYSRRLTARLGLRQIPGACCETVGELESALARLTEDDSPVIVKDAYGVSGRGLVVLDTPVKVGRLVRTLRRRVERTGDDALHVVVERFLPKRFDLNYQFTVGGDGRVTFDFVKRALTRDGVHVGHLMPSGLSDEQEDGVREAAALLGASLHQDGFRGVAGVDALLGADDLVYPVLEINARLNMSTYQGRVTERFGSGDGVALARHYPLRLTAPLPFDDLLAALGPLADPPTGGEGVALTCFGTVNAQAGGPVPFGGRLYTVLFAADRNRLTALDDQVAAALHTLEERP